MRQDLMKFWTHIEEFFHLGIAEELNCIIAFKVRINLLRLRIDGGMDEIG